MLEYIYKWIQNISVYMILIMTIIQMIPNQTYKKYIRFFTGLLLIILLITPILKVMDMDENFYQIFHSIAYQQDLAEIKEYEKHLSNVDIYDVIREEP